MSQQNLDIFHRSVEAFDRRDRDAWLAVRDQEYETIPSASWPEADAIRGPEAAWEFYVRIVETFKSQRFGDVEAIEAGADKVLVHQRNSVRGRTSGVEVVLDYWIVVTFRSGKMVRDRWFENRAEALAAAGLSE